MQLTPALLQARRKQALATRDQLLADLNSQVGVIATLDHLLSILAEPEPGVASTSAASPPEPAVPSSAQ